MIIPDSFVEKYNIENAIVCNPAYLPEVSTILSEERKCVVNNLLFKVFPFINSDITGLNSNVKSAMVEDSLCMSNLFGSYNDHRDKDIEYALSNSLNLYNNGRMFIFKLDNSERHFSHSYFINEYNKWNMDTNNLSGDHIISIFVENSGFNVDNGEDISFVYDMLDASFMSELSKYIPLTRIYRYCDKHIWYWLHNPKSAAIIKFAEPSATKFIALYYANLFAGIIEILDIDFDTFYNTMINKEESGFNILNIHKSMMRMIWDKAISKRGSEIFSMDVLEICDKLFI